MSYLTIQIEIRIVQVQCNNSPFFLVVFFNSHFYVPCPNLALYTFSYVQSVTNVFKTKVKITVKLFFSPVNSKISGSLF